MRELMFALLAIGAVSPGHAAGKSGALTVPSADGVPIAYEVHGQGEPALVLVHGWSCDRGYWKEQIEYLSPQYRLVLVDLAGHGESGMGRKDYTMSAFGADVAAVVDSLGLKNVVLVGHSMGGDVIVEAAKKLPGRVVGLVWVDEYKSLVRATSQPTSTPSSRNSARTSAARPMLRAPPVRAECRSQAGGSGREGHGLGAARDRR